MNEKKTNSHEMAKKKKSTSLLMTNEKICDVKQFEHELRNVVKKKEKGTVVKNLV